MVIVDTTVWIDYFHGVDNSETMWLDLELDRQRLGLTDIILCEVLQGVGDDDAAKDVERGLLRLEVFDTASRSPRNSSTCKKPGRSATTCLTVGRDERYTEAVAQFGSALERLACAYEAHADRRADLLQDIHVALWRSLAIFDGRCSLRTWVYRVAHNVATSQVTRRQARTPILVSLYELDISQGAPDAEGALDAQRDLERLMRFVHRLKPVDRQIVLLYLEDMDAASIAEITGISQGNVSTKIHRIKKVLAEAFARERQS